MLENYFITFHNFIFFRKWLPREKVKVTTGGLYILFYGLLIEAEFVVGLVFIL